VYVYVDESGQDDASKVFVAVAVGMFGNERYELEKAIIAHEDEARTGRRKWNHTRHARRVEFLSKILDREVGKKNVFFGIYQKPIHFFFPIVEIIEKTIKRMIEREYVAHVYVDGANKTVAQSLTNALRSRGITTRFARGKRDESEALIRLADMWAGCIRHAHLDKSDAKEIFERAKRRNYLFEIGT
jgi:hypothetical protein